MRDAFARAIYKEAKLNGKVFVVVADISPAASMAPFRQDFPDHFVDVGVSEQTMIGFCAGLAIRGFRPFAYTIAPFTIYRPFEQVRVDLCYQHLPVTVVGVGGGVAYSSLGGTHHTPEDIAVLSALPNMSIIAPCDPLEVESAVRACMESRGPVYLRLGKAGEPALTDKTPEPFAFGKIRRLKAGKDLCILSYGPIMKRCFDLAARLESNQHRSVAVVNVHTLKPLDLEGLAKVLASYPAAAVIEEHSIQGGLGAQLKQLAWEVAARCQLRVFSLKDEFIHFYGSQADLWDIHGLSLERMEKELLKII